MANTKNKQNPYETPENQQGLENIAAQAERQKKMEQHPEQFDPKHDETNPADVNPLTLDGTNIDGKTVEEADKEAREGKTTQEEIREDNPVPRAIYTGDHTTSEDGNE